MSGPLHLREAEKRLLQTLLEHQALTPPELTRLLGHTRSWVWKNLKSLREKDLVVQEGRGHASRVRPSPTSYRAILRLGLLRASEYPYAVPLRRLLHDISGEVQVVVYEDAYTLANHLAEGRVHLALAPLITLLLVHRASGGAVRIIAGGSRGGSGIAYRPGSLDPKASPHATTMASTMEYCAEKRGLRGPRVYARSAREILALLEEGRVDAGVLWEPYLTQAAERGYRVEDCGIEFCCVLGANVGLEPDFPRIRKAFEAAVVDARGGRVDLSAYAEMVGLERGLVEKTVARYEFFEDPPVREALENLEWLYSTMLPRRLLPGAFYTG